MALTKCKGCGAEISKKAKKCPKCGEPQKRTSLFTWLVLVLVAVIYFTFPEDDGQFVTHDVEDIPQIEDPSTSEPLSFWSVSESTDEMTGEASFYAISTPMYPAKLMEFPYRDVTGSVAVGCSGGKSWAYMYFTSAPNLTDTTTKDGYNNLRARVKWDDSLGEEEINQDWGSKVLHFVDDSGVIRRLQAHNLLKVELRWHGQQPVYFNFPLDGSSAAIAEATAKCRG